MVLALLGGLGLFIHGMHAMGEGLQKVAGDRLRRLLEVVTSHRILAVAAGVLVTSIVQSSSATTVMVVGFVNARLLSLTQAAGVIMGANIGTTITAQMVALKLTDLALPTVALGMGLRLFTRSRLYRHLGQVFFGFGLLFLGLGIMTQAMKPLRELAWFTEAMVVMGSNPLLGVLCGAVLTGLVQSSSATIGILQALAMQGLIGPGVFLPLLFGDNIGTTITAMLSSVGTSRNARRAALIHLLFNTVGTLIFLALLPLVSWLVIHTATDPVRQIANAHTMFNVANTAIQLPFIGLLVAAANRLIPGVDEGIERGLQYVDPRLLDTPAVAIGQSVKEIARMGRLAAETVSDAIEGFFRNDPRLIKQAFEKEEVVNDLEQRMTDFLAALARKSLTDRQAVRVTQLLNAVNDVERVGDHAENLAELAEYKVEQDLPFSAVAVDELRRMYEQAHKAFVQSLEALENQDTRVAWDVVRQEDVIDRTEKDLRANHIRRLNEGTCFPASGIIFLDIISNLERVGDHAAQIADSVLGEP
ncbi:MAG: Na/Pi cotransporter family protein [bacterium]|nr:Na/Pi cotransporter family protein [bacterium]